MWVSNSWTVISVLDGASIYAAWGNFEQHRGTYLILSFAVSKHFRVNPVLAGHQQQFGKAALQCIRIDIGEVVVRAIEAGVAISHKLPAAIEDSKCAVR